MTRDITIDKTGRLMLSDEIPMTLSPFRFYSISEILTLNPDFNCKSPVVKTVSPG
ncbi:hypothetical protein JGI24_01806 [Candidatus Kryptobacter tengchongensis]|uniref:Uncharacterized protein n=1 Tax=Kryptobacter tengchongensis TaxID=1643429 RepID=A0A656DBJ0_KRYT1|nr:hypothetical protein JGI24_01806 [Candidatus Kryptobacter tengchongensis]